MPRCATCGLEPTSTNPGVIDLIDVASGEPTATTTEQRLMESDLVARMYDRLWRPTFVRMLAGRGAGAAVGGLSGELFIHKHSLALDDRPGPWLDLSCGPGAFVRALAAAAPGALVVGLDISRAMLEVAAERTRGYTNAVLVRGDAHSLPFVDGAFGGVNNAGALHAYDDPELVFREIRRVLRPGGVYVGSTFAEASSLVGRIAARLVTGQPAAACAPVTRMSCWISISDMRWPRAGVMPMPLSPVGHRPSTPGVCEPL